MMNVGNASKNGRLTKQQRQITVWPPKRCVEFGAGAALPSLALIKEMNVHLMHYVNRLLRMPQTSNEGDCSMHEEHILEQRAVVVAYCGSYVG